MTHTHITYAMVDFALEKTVYFNGFIFLCFLLLKTRSAGFCLRFFNTVAKLTIISGKAVNRFTEILMKI